jgi:ketosteroid isomerase-like protein
VSAAGLEIVREIYDAFARQDGAAILARLHPDVEFHQTERLPWGGRYAGHDGARQFFERLREAIDSAVTVERFINAGDHVAVVGRTRGHTRSGQTPFDVAIVHVWTVRDARISRFDAYIDTPAMLAALASR